MKPYKIMLVFSLLIFLSAVKSNAALVDVSADTLEKWITAGTSFDFILIDIRDTSELTAVIASDACRPYHLSWREGVFVSDMNKLPKNAHIFLYCARGNRSGTAGQLLVDSGYVSVYHLVGGFNGWGSRQTMPPSSVKPPSELPAPSMLKISVHITAQSVQPERGIAIWRKSGVIVVNAPLNQGHLLELFDMQGRLVVRITDPFKSGSRYALPRGLAGQSVCGAAVCFRKQGIGCCF
jgi:rhodanese-related sulfurtransferase